MEFSERKKKAFLNEFGHSVEKAIYSKFNSKSEFARETGFLRKNLHKILTGKDTRISTLWKLSVALGVKPQDLLPKNDT